MEGAESRPTVPVLVGPTASGKTALVLALAESWKLAAVSADSRQLYRGMDIGTAKPRREQLERVPHYGIDVVDPSERYSAGRFAREARNWLTEVEPDRQPIVVGGTGFYVKALADGLFREPSMDPLRREKLRGWLKGLERVGAWAARLDSGYTGGGRQRASRAVEVALLTGKPLSQWQREAKTQGIMKPWYLRLTLPRPVLRARIERRAKGMLWNGWIEEVESLLRSGVDPQAPGFNAVGYREVVAFLRGDFDKDSLTERIVTATRRYAKRQETWFRHQLVGEPVITLDATDEPEVLARQVIQMWEDRQSQ